MDAARVKALSDQSIAVQQAFFGARGRDVAEAGRRIADAVRGGGKVLAFGNGGSAADAQHLAGELVGRYLRDRRALPALALTTDPTVVTAIGNDLGFDRVFERQVEAHGLPGDVALGITTSGRSPNVLAGLHAARAGRLLTVALTGAGGRALAGEVDVLLDVQSTDTPRVQEVHAVVIHLICQIVEEALAP